MVFPLIGALVGGALGLGASAISANSTKNATQAATKASNDATDKNLAYLQGVRNDTKATLSPFITQGQGFNSTVNDLLKTNPFSGDIGTFDPNDPQFRFIFDNAMKATNAQFGDAIGSGGRLKALQDRAGFVTNNYLNDWFNRQQATNAGQNSAVTNYLNFLTGQQQQGLSAANALAGVSTNLAGQVTNANNVNASNIGNAALVNGANQNALLSGLAGAAGNFFGQQQWSQPNRGSSYVSVPPTNAPIDPRVIY